jgi:hypothetical protein
MAKQISEFTEAASAPAGSFYLIELADGTYRSIDEANVTGGGDMSISVYDPTAVSGDAFDMDNMVEGATNLILTAAERAVIAAAVTGLLELHSRRCSPRPGQERVGRNATQGRACLRDWIPRRF